MASLMRDLRTVLHHFLFDPFVSELIILLDRFFMGFNCCLSVHSYPSLHLEENEVQDHFNEIVINVTTTLGRTAGPSEPDFDVDVDLDVDVAMDPKPTQSHLPEPGRGRNVAVAGNPEPKHPPDKADPFDEDEDMWDMINQVHG